MSVQVEPEYAWGTQNGIFIDGQHRRFIPTGVGNAFINDIDTRQVAVHPHGCGERFFLIAAASDFAGSSPRVWGTHKHLVI